jgi:hypothetical protein
MPRAHIAPTRAALVLLASLLVPVAAAASDSEDGEKPKHPKLKAGQTVQADIATGATHTYRIKLKEGAALRVVVSAVDIAVTASVARTDGTRVESSSTTDGQAFELSSTVEETWLLEVRPAGGGTAGRYTVTVGAASQ